MDSGDTIMNSYFEKKTGIIWLIATILLFYYIFAPIIRELVAAFLAAIAIGISIWAASITRKHATNHSTK